MGSDPRRPPDLVARPVTRNQRLFCEFHGGQLSAYASGLVTVASGLRGVDAQAGRHSPDRRRHRRARRCRRQADGNMEVTIRGEAIITWSQFTELGDGLAAPTDGDAG